VMDDTKPIKKTLFNRFKNAYSAFFHNETPAPTIEAHALDHGKSSTRTLQYTLKRQIDDARSPSGVYNPDIIPYQDPVLRKHGALDIENPVIREEIYETSEFLKKHSKDITWRIMARGFSFYKRGEKCPACDNGTVDIDPGLCTCKSIDTMPDLTPELKQNIIEAFSRGLSIDTAFLVRWGNGKYVWFTRNDIWNDYVYGTKRYRDIEEVYLHYDRLDNIILDENTYHPIVGFLTQHSKVDSRPARQAVLEITETQNTELADKVYRDCVVIQPLPNVRSVFGEPALKVEVDTSSQKKSLRTLEFAYLHMGGSKRTVVAPSGTEDKVKDVIIKDIIRGIHSKGAYIEADMTAGTNINDMLIVADNPVQTLPFDVVDSHINADAQLSKQKIEGAAPSGALGGQAPKIDMTMDEEQLDSYYFMFEQVLRDVYDVFFGIPGYEEEELSLGEGDKKRKIINRVPAYEIRFNDMVVANPNADEGMGAENRQNPMDKTTSKTENNAILVEAHAIANPFQSHVTFEGNMFAPGTYEYKRQKNKHVTYTSQEIKHLTEQPVKSAYLEINQT